MLYGHVHQIQYNQIGNIAFNSVMATAWPWPYPSTYALAESHLPVLTVPMRATDHPAMFGNILCALDFSPASVKALELAASLRRAPQRELTVLHVLEPQSLFEPVAAAGPGTDVPLTSACEQLHELVPRGLAAREIVTRGTAYEEILTYAGRHDADLIVLGVHSGLRERLGFLGSTASHIVREATCPVLSVRL